MGNAESRKFLKNDLMRGEFGKKQTIYSEGKDRVASEDFELLAVIGRGSFGKVMQVRRISNGGIYAMKILNKKEIVERKQVTHSRFERDFLTLIDHPFFVRLRFAFQTEEKLYLILDYIAGGELYQQLKRDGRFSETRTLFYLAELVCALSYLHKKNIVYRDLKLENVLIGTDGHIVVTDFGLSKILETVVELNADGEEVVKTNTFCGTPEYLAPELLRHKGHGTEVDWWSLGILAYELLTGMPPFYSENRQVMYVRILKEEVRFPAWFSPNARSLISGLLKRNPHERLGDGPQGSELDIKTHPFFAGIDWDDVEAKSLKPPVVPKIRNETDRTRFDQNLVLGMVCRRFFNDNMGVQPAVESPARSPMTESQAELCKQFEGFTYARSFEHIGATAEESEE